MSTFNFGSVLVPPISSAEVLALVAEYELAESVTMTDTTPFYDWVYRNKGVVKLSEVCIRLAFPL